MLLLVINSIVSAFVQLMATSGMVGVGPQTLGKVLLWDSFQEERTATVIGTGQYWHPQIRAANEGTLHHRENRLKGQWACSLLVLALNPVPNMYSFYNSREYKCVHHSVQATDPSDLV